MLLDQYVHNTTHPASLDQQLVEQDELLKQHWTIDTFFHSPTPLELALRRNVVKWLLAVFVLYFSAIFGMLLWPYIYAPDYTFRTFRSLNPIFVAAQDASTLTSWACFRVSQSRDLPESSTRGLAACVADRAQHSRHLLCSHRRDRPSSGIHPCLAVHVACLSSALTLRVAAADFLAEHSGARVPVPGDGGALEDGFKHLQPYHARPAQVRAPGGFACRRANACACCAGR